VVRGCSAFMALLKPGHEFGPGRRLGTTDCGTLQRSTRGRSFFISVS
jgi:hypothetical protein